MTVPVREDPRRRDQRDPPARRTYGLLVYLVAALALVGAVSVWMGAEVSHRLLNLSIEEANSQILSDFMGALAASDAPKL